MNTIDLDRIKSNLNAGEYDQRDAWDLLKEVDRLRAENSCFLGLGDGSGDLFVYGSYESIKACQGITLECDQLRKKLSVAEKTERLLFKLGIAIGTLTYIARNQAIADDLTYCVKAEEALAKIRGEK